MIYHSLFISSLTGRLFFIISKLHRKHKNYYFSELKPALGRKRSSFDGTTKTFHDIISLMLNNYGQSL